jgi:hypothetical protein
VRAADGRAAADIFGPLNSTTAVGDQLAAAGYVVSSREYAEGTDPFKMGRRVRALALGKFGIDLDDSASFPRAAQAFIKTGAERAGFFLKHRKRVFLALSEHFFPALLAAGDVEGARERVKLLFNLLDMDGSAISWLEDHRSDMRLYINHASLLQLRVPLPPTQDGANPADIFDFGAYTWRSSARERQRWLTGCRRH